MFAPLFVASLTQLTIFAFAFVTMIFFVELKAPVFWCGLLVLAAAIYFRPPPKAVAKGKSKSTVGESTENPPQRSKFVLLATIGAILCLGDLAYHTPSAYAETNAYVDARAKAAEQARKKKQTLAAFEEQGDLLDEYLSAPPERRAAIKALVHARSKAEVNNTTWATFEKSLFDFETKVAKANETAALRETLFDEGHLEQRNLLAEYVNCGSDKRRKEIMVETIKHALEPDPDYKWHNLLGLLQRAEVRIRNEKAIGAATPPTKEAHP